MIAARSCNTLLVTAAAITVAQALPARSTSVAAPAAEMLALRVLVNGVPNGTVVAVKIDAGTTRMRAVELRRARIRVRPAVADDEWVSLASIGGIRFRIDEPHQTIEITASDVARTSYQVDLSASEPAGAVGTASVSALLLNYDLYGVTPAGGSPGYVGADLEARLMTGKGAFVVTGLVNSSPIVTGSRAVRLDSYWRHVDPVAVRSYTVGDLISGALEWSNAYRIGGVQMQSAFEQRSDLVTRALPSFNGATALPSSLDVFIDNLRVYSGEVPAGPFAVTSLPDVNGGDVRIVTRDATGRESVINTRYYYSPRVLRAGTLEYSVEAGFPRRDFGTRSFNYDPRPVAAASARYGLRDDLTVEGRLEASAGLLDGGVGMTHTIGGIGALSVSAAGSAFDGRIGVKGTMQWDMRLGNFSLFAGTQRSSAAYFDIARVSQRREQRRLSGTFGDVIGYDDIGYARQIDRAGIALQLPFDRATSLSAGYSALRDGVSFVRAGTFSATRAITSRINLYTNGFRSVDRSRGYGGTVGVNLRLGARTSASIAGSHTRYGDAVEFQASGATDRRQGALGWAVYDREARDGTSFRRAQATYRASWAYLNAGIEQSGSDARAVGQASGAILLLSDSVRAVNHVGSSFALVHNAGPGADVRQDTVVIATADRHGSAFLPDLLPYRATAISIDPAKLPSDWATSSTEQLIAPGFQNGVVIDFGARKARSALVTLVDREDEPLPPGSSVIREDGSNTLVGYDGQVYLADVSMQETIVVARGEGGGCRAVIAYPAGRDGQVKIGPVACR